MCVDLLNIVPLCSTGLMTMLRTVSVRVTHNQSPEWLTQLTISWTFKPSNDIVINSPNILGAPTSTSISSTFHDLSSTPFALTGGLLSAIIYIRQTIPDLFSSPSVQLVLQRLILLLISHCSKSDLYIQCAGCYSCCFYHSIP